MGSLGNQTFQGMPNLHPEVRRRLDDLVKALNSNATQIQGLSQDTVSKQEAQRIALDAVNKAIRFPLNIANATGQAASPQTAMIPIVSALPTTGQVLGEAVQFSNNIYIWNGASWVAAFQTVGLSVTITTAKLTGGGSNGSMTFVNGLLTAQTPAT